jgi:hypothetical protein
MIDRPAPSEYSRFFERYISLVPTTDIVAELDHQRAATAAVIGQVAEDRAGFRYAPGKWSIREVLGHVIDAERVFGWRALCVARGDPQPLPGFEENDYAASAGHDQCRLASLGEEFDGLRRSHVLMLRHLPDPAWLRVGNANGNPVSVRALAYILVGHLRHHLSVLEQRYGVATGA